MYLEEISPRISTHCRVKSSIWSRTFVASRKETASSRTIGIKRHAILSKNGEQLFLTGADKCVIVTLINSRLDETSLFTDIDHLLNFIGPEVGDAPSFDLTISVALVQSFDGWLNRIVTIRYVKIIDIDLVDL